MDKLLVVFVVFVSFFYSFINLFIIIIFFLSPSFFRAMCGPSFLTATFRRIFLKELAPAKTARSLEESFAKKISRESISFSL